MKKLIALMFCLAVMATVARAEFPNAKSDAMQQAVDQQVTAAQRVITLRVNTGSLPTIQATGKAVMIGTKGGNLVVLTSRALADDIDSMGDEPVFAILVNGKKKTYAMVVNMKADNPAMNKHYYILTLKGRDNTFSKLPPLPLEEARKLL